VADSFSCARNSLDSGEPCFATASTVRRWILVEQPGGWGADALHDSRLALSTAAALRAVGRRVGARVLLIRAPGRYQPEYRRCFAAVTTTDVRRVERFDVDDPAELLAVDWSPLARDEPVGGHPVERPLYLVCTNGRHDPDCATLGRPVAAALGEHYGERVWEASHYGGDRFAGNLVCLPHGLYYGRVSGVVGAHIAAAYEEGRVALEHFRGRSCYGFPVQAAEHFARREEGLTGVDDLTLEAVEQAGGDVIRAAFTDPRGRRLTVTVETLLDQAPRQLTCHSAVAEIPPRYRLVDYATTAAGSRGPSTG